MAQQAFGAPGIQATVPALLHRRFGHLSDVLGVADEPWLAVHPAISPHLPTAFSRGRIGVAGHQAEDEQ